MIHIVKRGDTLSSIAAMYGVSVSRIIGDNGLQGLPWLVVGQALIILITDVMHTVSQGDTIASVAAAYSLTVPELLQRNPYLSRNPALYPGQQLSISFQNQGDARIMTNGYAYPFISRGLAETIMPFMSNFTIFGYGFNEDGSLIPVNDRPLIQLCYRHETAPVLLLSSITENGNFSSAAASRLFNNIQLQQTVIDNLLVVMRSNRYLGIDIDFEYISPDDADAFIAFLVNVTERMHQNGYFVNVDLAPKTSSRQRGLLYESHDYLRIGEIADTVLLMTYEWGYAFGPPLAVAPLPNVRRVAEYAVSEIPPEKIMLGIPNYGYDWALPFEQGISKAVSIGNDYAIRIAAQNRAEIRYDISVQSPYFEYTDNNGNAHIVWFEDVRSIDAKLNLIKELRLRGAGYWNLMRPFTQNWALLSLRCAIGRVVTNARFPFP